MSSGLFGAIKTSASGLRGQRSKMDVIAQNLANAETTRTAEGTPYRRKRVIFEQVLGEKVGNHRLKMTRGDQNDNLMITNKGHMQGSRGSESPKTAPGVDQSIGLAEDASDFRVVHDPGHPDADADGYVLYPNVNPISEMVDMISASRAYEASISAVQSAKEMFSQALKI